MKIISLLIILSVLGLVSGCATTIYKTIYYTELLDSEPKSLQFRDDKFVFEFLPVPNGVYFKIENLSVMPGFLVWDRCYFIEPGGNSSKALNVDLLEENIATRDKAIYESTLPPNAIFARFTTSALNMKEFSSLRSSQITNYFLGITRSFAEVNKFYNFGRYWPEYKLAYQDSLSEDAYEYKKILTEKGFTDISDYAISNDRLGLGLCIRLWEEYFDYRFDFRFDKIEVYELKGDKERLIGSASKSDSWKWNHIKTL